MKRDATPSAALPLHSAPAADGQLSYAQHAAWLAQRLRSHTTAFNIFAALDCHRPFEPAALRVALDGLVADHAALRLTFPEVDGRPVRRVAAELRLPYQVVEAASFSEDRLRREIYAFAERPFDLTHGPLCRARFYLQGEGFVILLAGHHSVVDFASLSLLASELTDRFAAQVDGRAMAFAPTDDADYLAWERELVRGPRAPRHLAYWRGVLENAPPRLVLPTDRRAEGEGAAPQGGAPLRVDVSAACLERLEGLAADCQGTLYSVLLAAVSCWLFRLCERDDFILGTTLSQRRRAALRSVVGSLINTVPVRMRVEGSASFAALHAEVRRQLPDLVGHAAAPFHWLVENLPRQTWAAERPATLEALTPFVFNFAVGRYGGHPGTPRYWAQCGASAELMVTAYDMEQGLNLNFNYDETLFDRTTIDALAASLVTLLEGLAEHRDTPIVDIPLASGGGRAGWWAGPTRDLGSQTCVELFAARLEEYRERPAVGHGDRTWTYGTLAAQATRLTGELRAQGVGHESIVGVLCPRGPELVAAVLGVLGAGAAFLPLDPAHPPERWRLLLEAGEARVVVGDGAALARLPGGDRGNRGPRRLPLDVLFASPVDESAAQFSPTATGLDALAYVMFTSGSTGTPKGVLVEQRGLLNHTLAKIEVTGLGPDDVLLQSASPAFVISVWQMLAPLLVGARLQVIDDAALAEPGSVFETLETAGVTLVQTVPSLLGVWLQDERAGALGRLRLCISTGEALSPELARRWLSRFPGVPLLNAYGPTECSDDVTHALFRRPPALAVARLPIGEPIANVEVGVCDNGQRPLPVGLPGEICVRGAAVARGYINLPSQAPSGFVSGTKRLYRTGDRGRRLGDGRIEYLGRVDQQIKIRGHRVELGEIENLMLETPGVRGAAARLWSDRRDEARLVGYVVPAEPRLLAAVEAHLTARLPAVLRPSQLVGLAALPLNPNGKLDRRALPRPEARLRSPTPPRNEREATVAALWQQVLDLPEGVPLGVFDNFFALGGHSLLLMELHQRLRVALGASPSVAELFEAPTIAAMAARLDSPTPGASELAPILHNEDEVRGAPLSSVQERFWILEQLRPRSPQLNLAAAMRLSGPLEVDALRDAFTELLSRHEALRTRFGFAAGRPYQVVEAAGLAAELSVFDASGSTFAEVQERAVAAAQRGFDVSQAPLVRLELYRLAAEDHLLVVVAHHLVCDGWSVELLIRDSLAIYAARLAGTTPSLPEVVVQLRDYARWEAAQPDEAFADDLAYWRKALAGAKALALPTAFASADAQAQHMAVAQRRLTGAALAAPRALARAEETSLFRVLLTSLHAMLGRLCGETDVSIAVTAALRDRAELQQTVGFLVNTVLVRADLSGDPGFRALLAQVHRQGIAAARHQALPFERLLRVLQREAVTADGMSPMQTYLTFNQRSRDRYREGALELELVDLPPPSPFVDLSFCADEGPEHLDLRVTYDAAQFSAPQVEQMLEHWQQILSQVCERPETLLSELSLTPPSRVPRRRGGPRASEPTTWTDTEMSGTLTERFASIEARFAERPAVVTRAGSLSYRQLGVRARRLARRLLGLGAAGERVAILFHNDAWRLPVGVFGPLFAGQAFVPLDSTHPDQRLREVLASAEPVALVHDVDLAERAAGLFDAARLVSVEESAGDDGAGDDGVPTDDRAEKDILPRVAPDDLAYLMFTSGSTGRPKGVMQLHRHVLHFMRAFGDELGGVGPTDRVSLLANAAHDAGLMDFFAAFMHGATLYPMDVRRHGLSESLAWLRDAEISLVHTTPTFFRAWVTNLDAGPPPAQLRVVTFDGEPSLRRDVALFADHFPQSAWLLNCYGSTESSISLRALTQNPRDLPERPAFSLEGPVDRTGVSLRTPLGAQAGLYGLGEIVIDSAFVTPGYWRDEELTAAVFGPLPNGRRAYRTGDLGRWLPDGRIEVVGRKDRQIKILGQRVELSEVEGGIRGLTGAADTCVIYRDLGNGQQRLEAYLSAPTKPVDEVALRAELLASLPPFMVPQRIRVLERIPRTANTKIDSAALLRMAASFDEGPRGDAPGSALEAELAVLWRDLLGVTQVGVEQSFFDLGGNSLQLLELHHRLRQKGRQLEVVELFRFPTIRSLAERLERGDVAASDEQGDEARARGEKRRAARGRRRT